jgi:hypothetical protein
MMAALTFIAVLASMWGIYLSIDMRSPVLFMLNFGCLVWNLFYLVPA